MSHRRSKMKHKQKPGRLILMVLLTAVLLLGVIKAGQVVARYWRLSSIVRVENSELLDALERIERLEKEIERLSSDMEYIEKIAREEYGMVKKGEEMFQISAPETEEKGR